MKFKTIYLFLSLFFCSLTTSLIAVTFLNDVHSANNLTALDAIHQPKSEADLISLIQLANQKDLKISISARRHAMGGQQFAQDSLHINMNQMHKIHYFDQEKGIIRVDAGITWGQLIPRMLAMQTSEQAKWGIIQKQTGADDISLGGSLSANAHGRGLIFQPIIQDIIGFHLIDAKGQRSYISRQENPELFSLVIGGYGLFGVISSIDLKLSPRQKLQRHVKEVHISDLAQTFRTAINQGYLYGDFQFNFDSNSSDFLKKGIFSAYLPAKNPDLRVQTRQFNEALWQRFLLLCVENKDKAYDLYSDYYLSTDSQIYWSDTHQLSVYNPDYMDFITKKYPQYNNHHLMISELYVPLDELASFMEDVKYEALNSKMNIVYGTIRLIKKDQDSMLAWAKQDYACIIFNLMINHYDYDEDLFKAQFQSLINQALKRNGSYFLTYHRWASDEQLLEAYPQFPQFLERKRFYDVEERFQSEWYRHYQHLR